MWIDAIVTFFLQKPQESGAESSAEAVIHDHNFGSGSATLIKKYC
jgi:hypothetical protein